MKTLLLGTAAAAMAAVAAAQSPAPTPAPHADHMRMMDTVQTRDGVVAMVRDHFAKMDENRDGFVTKDEMKEAREEIREVRMERREDMKERREERREKRMAMSDPNAAFDRIDANKDGSISRDEFAKGRQIRIEKRIVMNGDGKAHAPGTSGAPHVMRMHRMGGMGGHGMMMRMADADKDGKVSLAEAQAAAVRHFDMMDANRDGQVTPEERKGAREKMRAMHAPKAS